MPRFNRVLSGETQIPPPVWLMRQAGRYLPEYRELRRRAGDFLTFCYTPELVVEAMLQPVNRFRLDASILFSDILVIPDALGVEVTFGDANGPQLRPVRTLEQVAELRREGICEHLSAVFDAVKIAVQVLPKEVPVIGFAGSPWTVACYMVEGHGSKDFGWPRRWALGDPTGFQQLIDLLVEATAEYLIEQVRQGVQAIQLFDTWAGLLPVDGFDRWCVAPTRAVVDRVRTVWPSVPIIGFPRGAGLMLKRFAELSGVNAVSLDSTVPVGWAARELQPHLPVQGNLDPLAVVVGGEGMCARIRVILGALGRGPFVFNLGHGLLPDTPPENVHELVETVRAWRA
jgi:uroporphyrinogen decarboxylase